jgi:DNA repair exonuclease SbcCD ATPase subunit
MKAGDQRNIIEQLLGITLLSEKAENLKEQIRISKDAIATENTRIETVKASNERIQQSIDALERKQRLWDETQEKNLENILKSIDHLSHIDVEAEIAAHKELAVFNQKRKDIDDLNKAVSRAELDEARETKQVEKLKKEIKDLEDHKCYACGQDLHDSKHEEVLETKKKSLEESALQVSNTNTQFCILRYSFILKYGMSFKSSFNSSLCADSSMFIWKSSSSRASSTTSSDSSSCISRFCNLRSQCWVPSRSHI